MLGDGGIYTSLTDYLAWDQALYTERLVSKQLLQQAFQSGHLREASESMGYGFGWRVADRHGVRLLYHDGRTSGFNNAVRRVPERHTTVVVFTNRAGAHAGTIADGILGHLLGDLD